MIGTLPPENTTAPEYVAHLHDSLKKLHEHVSNQMGHHLQQQKTHHNALIQRKEFEVGDLVWLHNPAVPRGSSASCIDTGLDHIRWSNEFLKLYTCYSISRGSGRPVIDFDHLKPCPPSIRLTRQDTPQAQGHARA